MRLPHTSLPLWPSGITPARFASTVRTDAPDGCRIGLIGLADDFGVRLNGGRFGAAEGPRLFRDALARYGVANPDGIEWPKVFDAGDVIPSGTMSESGLAETHRRVTEVTKAVLDLGLFPIAVGGGHDLTFPFVRAVAAKFPNLGGVYADAHLDVREQAGSGMPFRRLIEDCKAGPLWVHGMQPLVNSAEHVSWFLAHGGRVVDGDDARPLAGDRAAHPPEPFVLAPNFAGSDAAEQRDLFVSFDLDVIDAAHAPGVSAMNPAGWDTRRAERFVRAAGRDPRVRCFDIMELCPDHDENNRTARVAAFLFLTFLAGFAERDS